jgi:hypothetical protein
MAGHEGFKSDLHELTTRVLEELLGFFSEVAEIKNLDVESQRILTRFHDGLTTIYEHETNLNITKLLSRLKSKLGL